MATGGGGRLTRKANAIPGGGGGNYGYDRGAGTAVKRQNLTFVKGNRAADDLDPVSQQILEVAATGTSIFDPVLCKLCLSLVLPAGRPGA